MVGAFLCVIEKQHNIEECDFERKFERVFLEHLIITQGIETVLRLYRSEYEWSGNLWGFDE